MAHITKQENQPMSNKMKVRLNRIVGGLMILMTLYIFVHLFINSVMKSDFYREYATKQQLSDKQLNANRGAIYDKNGAILAKSATVWSVVIAPSIIEQDAVYLETASVPLEQREKLVQELASLLGLNDLEDLEKKIQTEKRFVLIKSKLSEAEVAKVKGFIGAGHAGVMLSKEAVAKGLADILELDYDKVLKRTYKDNQYEVVKNKVEKPAADQIRKLITDHNFTFITLLEDTKRYYPNNEMLSNVLGFTGADNQGLYGLEYQYDDLLKGKNGKLMLATDGLGNPIPTNFEQKYDPIEGKSLVTTIDENVQRYTENALTELVKLNKPEGGALAIVMDVNTGGILAMANSKNYDLNKPNEIYSEELKNELDASDLSSEEKRKQAQQTILAKQRGNDAISKLYEPGSVYKVITAAAALESGHTLTSDHYYCPGFQIVGGERMNCNQREGHGNITFRDAIVKSCNPAFIQIGLNMGSNVFEEYFKNFGLDQATGIDLPGEAKKSIYVPLNKMGPVELASSSFGQTMALTPLQMITAMSTVANGGYLVQPHMVTKVLDHNGNIAQTKQPPYRRQVISKETVDILRDATEGMVEQSPAYIPGYRIGGKSGTSQKQNNSDNGRYASFLAFAPADKPQIAILVMADQPTQASYYGSAVCGPAVASIMGETLAYMGVMPQYTEEDFNNMNLPVPNVVAQEVDIATKTLKDQGLKAQIYGKGKTVVDQMPRSASIAKGSKVILYTEPDYESEYVTVPNVMGLSLEQANKALTDVGLTISLERNLSQGENVTVLYQSYVAGTHLLRGSTITIKYGATLRDE